MKLTRHAIEKNRITATVLLIIAVWGMMVFFNMPRNEDPGFIIRTALVMTYFPGASPGRVEQLVTDRLEKVIQEMPELQVVSSLSRNSISEIYVDIKESYTDMRPIFDKLRRKVDRVRSEMPEGVYGPFVNDEFGDVFGINISITGEGFSYAELKEVADEVRDELLGVDEVAKVDVYGAQDERIFIEFNAAKLSKLGLSTSQLKNMLEGRNIILSGGEIVSGIERISVQPSGSFTSLDDLRRTLIPISSRQGLVHLQDIAEVNRGYVEPADTRMHFTGTPCIGLAVSMREGGNIIHLGEKVREKVDYLKTQYPIGIEFGYITMMSEDVRKSVDDFLLNLRDSMIIVVVVMLLTLGFRTGLIVASLIPATIILSFLVMGFFSIGLDQISLAALIIALGMLVDNAIVLSEAVMVAMASGKSALDSAIDASEELKIPLLISSLTTAAAFLSIFLAKSAVGEYTAPLFKVVTIALISSWVLSLTMIPMLCVYALKVPPATRDPYNSLFYRFYRWMLVLFLKVRYLTLLLALLCFGFAMYGFKYIPSIFFPPIESSFFMADIRMPPNTRIEETESAVRKIESFMKKELMAEKSPEKKGVINWGTYIGQGAPRFRLGYSPGQEDSSTAFMIINTSSFRENREIMKKIEDYCLNNLFDLEISLNEMSNGPPVDKPVQIRISGKDENRIFSISEKVKEQLKKISGTKNITDDWGSRTKKLVVRINDSNAGRAGISNQDIAVSLQTMLTGFQISQFREKDKVIPVILRSDEERRQSIEKLENLNVYSQMNGNSVPLKQVADIEMTWESAKVMRRNRAKTITVNSGLLEGVTASDVIDEIDPWLKKQSLDWGVGYRYEYGGEIESSDQANNSIIEQLPVVGMIIFFLLILQFNSFRKTFIILFTIPLGMIGVVAGLLITKLYFGFMTLLGVVSLAGIVINNAIVLLDRIKLEIEDNGLDPARAIVESSQRRFRPIILTTATTIGGMLPLYFNGGAMWQPMAIVIIFGLLVSTVLTLGVVPVLYSILFRVGFKDFKY